jgi:hypothetical protein
VEEIALHHPRAAALIAAVEPCADLSASAAISC